jgi:hypothetical protein
MSIFSKLPEEIIHKIINYTNVVTYRYGKYIDKIHQKDKRYILLDEIERPVKISNSKIVLKLINYLYSEPHGYYIEYTFGNLIKINIKFVRLELYYFDKILAIKSNGKFITDINGNLSKVIDYSM